MSEDVRYKGSLKKVDPNGVYSNTKDIAHALCRRLNLEVSDVDGDYLECLMEETNYEKYIIIHGELYEIIKMDRLSDNPMMADVFPDGSIDFDVTYYNGGYGTAEAIEEALNEH